MMLKCPLFGSGQILIVLIGAKSVQVTEIRGPNCFESVVQCPNEAPRARAAEFAVVWSASRARKALSSADYWPGRTENDEPPARRRRPRALIEKISKFASHSPCGNIIKCADLSSRRRPPVFEN